MKRIVITGLIMVLVTMFVVTCGPGVPEEEVEYTDVEYSEDGSRVTVYLDGVGVPITKAQRAMSTDLAKMAYDFLEVVFIGATDTAVARASWEIGEAAGISGVPKPIDYIWAGGKTSNVAIMFVGRGEDKTLFGVGRIAEVDHSASSSTAPPGFSGTWNGGWATNNMPNTIWARVTSNSKSVTFYLEAVKTGLVAGGDPTPDGTLTWTDSFDYTGAITGTTIDGTWLRADKSSRLTNLTTNTSYPIYALPQAEDCTVVPSGGPQMGASYIFKGAAETFSGEIRFAKVPTLLGGGIVVQKRIPRYMDGGRYKVPKDRIDTSSTIALGTYTPTAANVAIVPTIPLIFTTKGSGIFSFYIEIPVYAITLNESQNKGPEAEIWKLRTGFGADLYSLDDGLAGGGCVLMGVGSSTADDWLAIEWVWL